MEDFRHRSAMIWFMFEKDPSGCSAENGQYEGKSGSRQTVWVAMALGQAGDGGRLEVAVQWTEMQDSSYILKIEQSRFAVRLDMGEGEG